MGWSGRVTLLDGPNAIMTAEESVSIADTQLCVDDTVSLVGNRKQTVRAISAIMTT